MAVIITAILSAAGYGLSAKSASGPLPVAALALAYYCGGYVAGRMSRFDGGRQGFGTWLVGLVVTLLVGAAGAIFGSQYNVFDKLNLPRIPIKEGDLATGGAIALAALVLATLLAAIVGGKVGQRYHRRVDRAAPVDATRRRRHSGGWEAGSFGPASRRHLPRPLQGPGCVPGYVVQRKRDVQDRGLPHAAGQATFSIVGDSSSAIRSSTASSTGPWSAAMSPVSARSDRAPPIVTPESKRSNTRGSM